MFSVVVSTFIWIWSTFEFRLRAILEIQEMFYKVSKFDAIFSSGRIWTYLCLCLPISRLTVEKLLTTLLICTSYWEIIIDARIFFSIITIITFLQPCEYIKQDNDTLLWRWRGFTHCRMSDVSSLVSGARGNGWLTNSVFSLVFVKECTLTWLAVFDHYFDGNGRFYFDVLLLYVEKLKFFYYGGILQRRSRNLFCSE